MSSQIEYSVICIDDSDYMRNEDMRPNRLFVEQDSINIMCHHILTSRRENRVALLTQSDNFTIQPLTDNEIKVLNKLYSIPIKGQIKVCASIKTSLLVLKLSDKKALNCRKRITVFIGSPAKPEDDKTWEGLSVKLKKSNVSVNVVCFGPEIEPQIESLRKFITSVGKDSHLVIVPKGSHLNEVLAESPILKSNDSREVSLVNENSDPELALALKISNEMTRNEFQTNLTKAMNESMSTKSPQKVKQTSNPLTEEMDSKYHVMTEEEQLALALQMSLIESTKQQKKDIQKSNEKTDNEKTDNKKTDNKKTDNKKTDNKKTDNKKTGNERKDSK